MLRRDGYSCSYPGCSVRERLEIHHRDGDRWNNELGNLVTYCAAHHALITYQR